MDVDSTVARIKELKIQGATNVAIAALKAYSSASNKAAARRKLLASRPTEPMMYKVLNLNKSQKEILNKLKEDYEKITQNGVKKLGNIRSVFTHCHSGTVIKIIKKSKINTVYNTEARPLYQGRITAKELPKVIHSVDSNMDGLLEKSEAVLIGADAVLPTGVINKIGSAQLAKLANLRKIPFYVCTHSWKQAKKVKIEQRDPREVWNVKGVKIVNPAFDFVENKYITAIISERGVHSPKVFNSEHV